MTKGAVPFYSNTSDNTHCVQACFRMVLKHFLPDKDFSWKKLAQITKKEKGKGTWWFPALIKLKKLGVESQLIDPFDYEQFYKNNKKYLYKVYKKEIADWYVQKSNLLDVRQFIPQFLKEVDYKNRLATLADMEQLLTKDYLIGADVNANTLINQSGYISHMVVIFSIDDRYFLLHDPGLPPKPNWKVTKKLLLKAWQYPGKDTQSLVAFRSV